ncbi:hypothetical protein RND71_019396 [Anisodus tanguticus]|uniref:Uncharacterized protein n=1 Tax=Anisodus tanguticus TaxID=243964 RepID=A0AAE1VGE7_9SOLA|nr:hypothetical protein RND71_019396 [Anisodus tanguticus]
MSSWYVVLCRGPMSQWLTSKNDSSVGQVISIPKHPTVFMFWFSNRNSRNLDLTKRLPRAQPAQNQAGMVLVDRVAEGS